MVLFLERNDELVLSNMSTHMYILQMQKDKRWGRDLRKSEKYKVFSFLRGRKGKITIFLQEKGGTNFKLPEVEN